MKHATQLAFALAALTLGALSCDDPTHDNEVAALGDEVTGVPQGPLHRSGQPCLTCHGGSGPGNEQFSIGGTVYVAKSANAPLVGADVTLIDVNKSTKHATTNAAGNFYVSLANWAPVAPVHVAVAYGDTTVAMTTHIGRDGSCADCHFEPPGPTTNGHVYLVLDPADLQAPSAVADGGAP